MVKKILAAIIILAMMFALTIPVMANPNGTVDKFTPVIDGDRDEAYNQSFSFNIFDQHDAERGEGWWSTHGNTSTDTDANIWFLWDDSFLYAYVEVIQSEVLNIGDDHILNHDNPWEANSIELWVLWDDLYTAGERLKTSIEPLHNRKWGDGPFFDDLEPETQKIAKLTPRGYSAEFAIPIPSAFLKEGGQIKFTLQVNVFDGEGSIPVGVQIQDGTVFDVATLTLGAPIIIAEPEPEPEEDLGADGGDPDELPAAVVVEAPPAPAPQTNDAAALMGIVSLIGASGFSVFMKKRK